MRDEHLSGTIKSAGEGFAPPVPDVSGIVRRGTTRRWTARFAVAACVALVATGAVAVVRGGIGGPEVARPVAPAQAISLQWTPIAEAPLAPRTSRVSVWTGRELIVWGGDTGDDDPDSFVDGASYDPVRDKWTKLPPSPLATSNGRTAVWTGTEMILWGGEEGDGSHSAPDTGAAYDPAKRRWRRLPQAPYWSLAGHVAVWTGTEMLVWGGVTTDDRGAAAYDPQNDSWRILPPGPLDVRHSAEGAWTGDRLVIWGGKSQDGLPITGGEGAAFYPESGAWTPIADSPLDPALPLPATVWTGDELIVTGGLGPLAQDGAGAAYDPLADRWREIRDLPRAGERDGAPLDLNSFNGSAWTGDEALFVTADGVLSYDPVDDRWQLVDAPAEAKVSDAVSVWTGDALIVWGGRTWDSRSQTTGGWIGRE
jgi:hypothetical protein